MTPDEYCRALETYLTRKNEGHLIRIVGPAFERVRGWSERGVPLKVACHGIDRYFERYYAKGPRRRPVRVEFCEPDVLDVFDEWRRAVGVRGLGDEPAPASRPREALATHIERVIARLTTLRGTSDRPADASSRAVFIDEQVLAEAVAVLDPLRQQAERARGSARDEILAMLAQLDVRLIEAARAAAGAAIMGELRQQAEADLAPFRDRMPVPQWEHAVCAATDRALRERARLPTVVLA